jgi:hypothetical protein
LKTTYQRSNAQRRLTHSVSFYVARNLLKKGLLDFLIEAGCAQGYGLESND